MTLLGDPELTIAIEGSSVAYRSNEKWRRMVQARITVHHLDDVRKIELTCKIKIKKQVVVPVRGREEEITSITGMFTVVLLPSQAACSHGL